MTTTEITTEIKTTNQTERGCYRQLVWASAATPGQKRMKIHQQHKKLRAILVELESGDADEHRAPAWQTGAAFDKKSRGSAVNTDVYGVDEVDGQVLGIVQVRQFRRYRRYGYPEIRKDYFLVGRNENGVPFAHPVPSGVVRGAIRRKGSTPSTPVTAARGWIFDVTEHQLGRLIRQGDVALVPISALRGDFVELSETECTIVDSHVIRAERLVRESDTNVLYALNPTLHHQKGQHADVSCQGWTRVQVGRREQTWDFAKPTAD